MSDRLARALLLLQTKHYKDAEQALRQALAQEPTDDRAHALLALSLYHQDRSKNALTEVNTAIGLAPNTAFNYYVQALILLDLRRDDKAATAIKAAIRLDPEVARYYTLLGNIHLRRKAWDKALEAAEKGLSIDPENVSCINLRGRALVKLGRKDEADATLEIALARDPENAMTHANQGWALLHRGDARQAFEHFREALRIDPTSNWAREGIVEAMKARNLIYRLLLRYFLWMSRLTDEERWGVIGGLHAIRVGLRTGARLFPPLYLIAIPVNLLYFCFAMLTWTADPLFALVLRFDRFGRLALPKEEMTASTWVAMFLLTAELGALMALLWRNPAFLVLSLFALAMILPISGIFRCPKRQHGPNIGRIVLALYSALLSLGGLSASLLVLSNKAVAIGIAAAMGVLFALGWILYPWIATLTITLTRAAERGASLTS